MKKTFAAVSMAALIALTACGPKWTESESGYGYNIISQKGGKTLGYTPGSGVGIITDRGYAFKDLNRNGVLDKYEDWRLPAAKRAQDLASQLSIDEIAGLMLYSAHQAIPDSNMSDQQRKFLGEDNLRHVLVTRLASPEIAAKWNNNVQAFVEGVGHGIPANNSSDPRHGSTPTAEYDAGNGGTISLWPSSLGMAATFEPELVEKFGQIASEEYRALGIATALSPQIDLATEPRWSRFSGTFGEDPQLDSDMAKAYVDGFQTSTGKDEIEDGWGYMSVNAMIKHWPSGGPEEGGRDAHYNYGKYAVYPGKNFATHLRPFVEGAMDLRRGTHMASAVMPYYTISYNFDGKDNKVGNSYSKYIITDLLRDTYNFDGVVCSDWGITKDNNSITSFGTTCWGEETRTEVERHFDAILAGIDQFGGNNVKGPVIEAYNMWVKEFGQESADRRFQDSARRLLMNIFRVGLFENPYLDPVACTATVGKPEFMAEGYEAQLKSIVMLKNHGGVLPLAKTTKVYLPRPLQNADLPSRYFQVVDRAEDADVAILFIREPSTGSGYSTEDVAKGGNGYVPISLQYSDYTAEYAREVSIAGGDPKESFTNRSYKGKTVKASNKSEMDIVLETKKAMGDKPVIVIASVGRPMIMSEIEGSADAMLLSFSVQNQAIFDVVSGAFEPSGLLPMQMPADMKTVELQAEDVPHDMECYKDCDGNVYDFAFGLNWKGTIKDARTEKYAVLK